MERDLNELENSPDIVMSLQQPVDVDSDMGWLDRQQWDGSFVLQRYTYSLEDTMEQLQDNAHENTCQGNIFRFER
jgi:hypothetical protein